MTTTVTDAMKKIEEAAAKEKPNLRRVARLVPGTAERQGDVALVHLGEATDDVAELGELLARLAKSAKPKETTLRNLPAVVGEKTRERQVAVGTTQGSRHIAKGDVTLYAPVRGANPLVGPIVVSRRRWLLDHPEHAKVSAPAGSYLVVYERDWSREQQELRRVQD